MFLLQALEEALNLHSPASTQPGMNLGEGVANLRQQELHTQIAVLKEQVQTHGDFIWILLVV